jgi:hypothetical protein
MDQKNSQTKEPEVIRIESGAFIRLIEEVVSYMKKSQGQPEANRWIPADEAKLMLGITSNTSLQRLRDEGRIRFSQPMHKVILYDRASIEAYLEQHAKNTF